MRERSDGWLGRRWRIAEAHDAPPIAGLDAPEFIGRLLRQRGIETVLAAREFLNPDWYRPADPTVLGDWSAAIERLAQAAERGEQPAGLRAIEQIGFCHHDDIAELDLVNEEVGDIAFVVLADLHVLVLEAFGLDHQPWKIVCADNGNHGVEPGNRGQRTAHLILERKGFRHG